MFCPLKEGPLVQGSIWGLVLSSVLCGAWMGSGPLTNLEDMPGC